MRNSLTFSLLLGLAIAAISAQQVHNANAFSNTPTFVLGISSPASPLIVDLQSLTSSLTILPGVSSLSLIGPGSVLFIDGTWLQSTSSIDPTLISTVLGPVLSGLPTIVIGGTPALLQQSISGLPQVQLPSLPLISDGIRIFSTLPDGTRQATQLLVIAGFDYAVSAEFAWAQRALSQNAVSFASSAIKIDLRPLATAVPGDISTSSPCSSTTATFCWQFITSATVDTGDHSSPYGRVVSSLLLYHFDNFTSSSGSSSYTWNDLFLNDTIIPGVTAFPSNSTWRNLSEQDQVAVRTDEGNAVVDHGPASLTTAGSTTVSFTVGITNGTQGAPVTASQTATFSLKNANVTDFSGGGTGSWGYSIAARPASGKLPFQLIEGITDRVANGFPLKASGSFSTTFAHLNGQTIDQTSPVFFTGFSICGFSGPNGGC